MNAVDILSTFSPGFVVSCEDGVICLDKNARAILGVAQRTISTRAFAALLDDEARALLLAVLQGREKGDVLFMSSRMGGEGAWRNILFQGSVIERNADGSAALFSGYCVEIRDEQRFFRIFDFADYGLWDWNIATGDCSFCKNYHKMLGYDWPREQLPTKFAGWKALVHPADMGAVEFQEKMAEHKELDDSFEFCVRLRHKNGSYIWTIDKGAVTRRDENGRAIALQGTNQNIAVVRRNYEHLLERAMRDSLTQCYNRDFFRELWNELKMKSRQPVGILYVDICGLKMVNDLLGHDDGDMIILETVNILSTAVLVPKYIIRMGGDEFLVVLPDCTQTLLDESEERIRMYIDRKRQGGGMPVLFATGSHLIENRSDPVALAIRIAERRMQENKRAHYAEDRAWLIAYIEKKRGSKVEYFDRRL